MSISKVTSHYQVTSQFAYSREAYAVKDTRTGEIVSRWYLSLAAAVKRARFLNAQSAV